MNNENENNEHDFDLPEGDDKKATQTTKSVNVCTSCEG